jgi:hypothetical protein
LFTARAPGVPHALRKLLAVLLGLGHQLDREVALEPVLGGDQRLDVPVLDALHRDLVEVAGADEQLLAGRLLDPRQRHGGLEELNVLRTVDVGRGGLGEVHARRVVRRGLRAERHLLREVRRGRRVDERELGFLVAAAGRAAAAVVVAV